MDAAGPTIASPVPFAFWKREIIIPIQNGQYRIVPNYAGPTEGAGHTITLGDPELSYFCDLADLAGTNSDTRAFMFWSRSPLLERAPDGSILLRDARFYDPRAADRFTVALPEMRCESLPPPS